MKLKLFLLILIILRYLLPISYLFKYIIVNIKYKNLRGVYKYKDTNGGFKINKVLTKDDLDNFCTYIVPDKNIIATYYRLIKGKPRFVVNFSFNEYLECNKLDIIKYSATKEDYKIGKIPNFNYKINDEEQ